MRNAPVRFRVRAVLTAMLLAPVALQAQQASSLDAKHRELDRLFAPLSGPNTPGAAVAIIKDGQVIYQPNYGMANLDHGIPIGPETRFQVASVSKQFTAFAIQLLAAEGKLSLEDDVRKHIPELHDFGKVVRIRHMLNHTSGLREVGPVASAGGWRGEDLMTHEDQLDFARRLRELNFEPGSEYVYTNLSYTLLAEIVERVSGQSFPDFTRQRIFEPLGMSSTHFSANQREVIPNRATSYERVGDVYEERPLNYSSYGSTGLYTTLGDLIIWDRHLANPTVGGPAVMEAMHLAGRLNDGQEIGYASGLMLQQYRGQRVVAHTGSHGGYRMSFFRVPAQRFTVIIMSNNTEMDRTLMPRQVADIYLADVLAPPPARAQSSADARPQGPAPRLSRQAQQQYVGTFYSEEAGGLVEVEAKGDDLVLRYRKSASVMAPAGQDRFSTDEGTVEFVRNPAGSVTGFFLTNGRVRNLRFVRAELRILGDQGGR